MIYEPIKVDKLVSQISAVSDNIEDISEEVQNMTDVIGEVEDTIKERFYFLGLFCDLDQFKWAYFENIVFFSKYVYFDNWANLRSQVKD